MLDIVMIFLICTIPLKSQLFKYCKFAIRYFISDNLLIVMAAIVILMFIKYQTLDIEFSVI